MKYKLMAPSKCEFIEDSLSLQRKEASKYRKLNNLKLFKCSFRTLFVNLNSKHLAENICHPANSDFQNLTEKEKNKKKKHKQPFGWERFFFLITGSYVNNLQISE